MDLNWFEEMEARNPKDGVRTRFAPSPTGYMHVGNLRTALYTWLIARHSGGKFILRIEDTDQGRLVEGATEVIYATLRKCGLTWDEGPDIGGPVGPYIQTERRALYGKYAELLVEKGHAYYCFCEKTESEEDSGNFDRAADPCRDMSLEEARAKVAAGAPYVIRQKIPAEGSTVFSDAVFGDITVENSTLDDQVLIKRDGLPTYNFANVIDDHLMGITHVVRGSEYLSSAPKYNLLRPVETVGNRGHVLPHPAHQAGEGGAVHGPLRVEGGQLRPGPGQIGEDDGGGGGAAARPLLPQIGKPVLIRPVGHGPVRAGDIHPRGMGDGNMRAQGHICLSFWVDCAQYNTRRPARQRLSFPRERAILSGYETKRSVPPCPSSLSPREMSGGR